MQIWLTSNSFLEYCFNDCEATSGIIGKECSDLVMSTMGAGGRNEGRQAMYMSYVN